MTYRPLPEHQRDAWRGPTQITRADDYRKAAANLAANVLDLLRSEFFRDKASAVPYPRLRRLIEVIGDAEAIADEHGYRFRHPQTGQEVRLADIR